MIEKQEKSGYNEMQPLFWRKLQRRESSFCAWAHCESGDMVESQM